MKSKKPIPDVTTQEEKDIEELSAEELLDVSFCHSNYIMQANEDNRYEDGWFPVCLREFYDFEYQDILESRALKH